MADIIVRRLDDGVKERLRKRAQRHGRSLEAEAREILSQAAADEAEQQHARPKTGFGTLMRERFSKVGLTDEEWERFQEGIDELNANWTTRLPDFDR